jgi:uncharacterized membrane protein YgcG
MEDRGSISDQLAKLADLRQRGALSDQEFEGQKRLLLDAAQHRSFRHRGAIAVLAIAAVAVALAFLGMSTTTRPSKSEGDSGPVQISTVALTQSQVQTAINYAMSQVGHSTYNQRCLQLVSDAYAHAGISIGSSSDPITYWATNPKGYTEHAAPYGPYGSPPAGAILFWGQTQWSSDGHAAISLGNGTVVSSAAYPYANGPTEGEIFSLSKRSASTYHYLGYIVPGDLQPTPPPAVAAPAPTPATPPATTPTTSSLKATPNPSGSPVGGSSVQPAGGGSSVQPAGGGSSVQPAGGGSSVQPASGGSSGGGGGSGSSTPATTPATAPATSPPPTAPPAATTYSETVGGVSHTWANYSNAGGTEGPSIASNQTVQITCKVTGFAVADGNTWWYKIVSSPWNGAYYVSADAFYNDEATSGSLHGTPFVDPSVPNC